MNQDARSIALAYIKASANKDAAALERLLGPEVKFTSTANNVVGAKPYLAILKRLGLVWVRSDVKKVFVDGPEVCVIYDLVTDSAAGAVPLVEWLRVENEKIVSVTLFFDRVAFKPASDEIARRADQPAR